MKTYSLTTKTTDGTETTQIFPTAREMDDATEQAKRNADARELLQRYLKGETLRATLTWIRETAPGLGGAWYSSGLQDA